MRRATLPIALLCVMVMVWAAAVICPSLDLIVSGWFYDPQNGFLLAKNPVSLLLRTVAMRGAWVLGALLLVLLVISIFYDIICRKRGGVLTAIPQCIFLYKKKFLFLLLALLLGPVLIANLGFKDHWGRARPREVVEFGGTSQFSPAFQPQPVARKNGSFISGDGSFGFYLPCLAYLVPLGMRRRQSRRVFWGLMAAGGCFGFSRLAMGAHFLSDILSAAILMLASGAVLHIFMFGKERTRDYWRVWLRLDD